MGDKKIEDMKDYDLPEGQNPSPADGQDINPTEEQADEVSSTERQGTHVAIRQSQSYGLALRPDNGISLTEGEDNGVRNRKSRAGKVFAIGAAAALAIGFGVLTHNLVHKEESPVYNYLVGQGITAENAGILAPKINPEMTDNEKEFARIISGYPSNLQRVCVTSDILDNSHISRAELEATRKATLEGIVNPEEVYVVLANALGSTNPKKYSQQNTESALEGLLSFYNLFRGRGIDDEHISLLVYNPSGIYIDPSIKIDGESTETNFTTTVFRGVNSDKNDTLGVVISSPNPSLSESENRSCIEFEGGSFSSDDLLPTLTYKDRGTQYKRAIVIVQSFGAKKFLSNVPRSVSLDADKTPLTYLSDVLTLASPNDNSDYNINFLTILSKSIQRNPGFSIRKIIESENQAHPRGEKAEAGYYDSRGQNRNPLESRLYNEPFPF